MRAWRSQVSWEWRWLRAVRGPWAGLVVAILLAIYGAAQSVFAASAAITRLRLSSEEFASAGGDVAEALAQPYRIEYVDGNKQIDNPIRFDLETMQAALGSLRPFGQIDANLTFFATVASPVVFIVIGLLIGTHDRVAKTIRYRVTATGSAAVFTAKLVALASVAVAVVAALALTSMAASLAMRPLLPADIEAQLPSTTWSPALVAVLRLAALSAVIAWAWGLLGLVIGMFARRYVVPLVLTLLAVYVLPFFGPFDLREVENAWVVRWSAGGGFFTADSTVAASVPLAAAWTVALAAALGAAYVLDRRRSYFFT